MVRAGSPAEEVGSHSAGTGEVGRLWELEGRQWTTSPAWGSEAFPEEATCNQKVEECILGSKSEAGKGGGHCFWQRKKFIMEREDVMLVREEGLHLSRSCKLSQKIELCPKAMKKH